jgi:four helix bundle protein
MFSFEKMIAWQKSIEFVDQIFDIADGLPQKHQFSLGEQLRRAALSITNNLAEGSGRGTPALQRNFYDTAKGSTYEVVSILAIVLRRKLISEADFNHLRRTTGEITAIIFGLIRAAESKIDLSTKTFREEPSLYELESSKTRLKLLTQTTEGET